MGVRHLLKAGHRHIGALVGSDEVHTAQFIMGDRDPNSDADWEIYLSELGAAVWTSTSRSIKRQ